MFNFLNSKNKESGITVILCAYDRPHVLEEQVKAIKAQSVPVHDIWLWYNKGEKPQIDVPGLKVAMCNYNFKFFGRFAFAMLAQTEYVAIFDDDTIPGKNWFKHCLDHMSQLNGLLGTTGIQLQKKMYGNHIKVGWNGTNGNNETTEQVDLIGHAWFLKKEWLKYMWFEDPVSWDNGEDIHLSYSIKKFGKIESYVIPHPSNDLSVWGSTKGSDYGSDENASWKKHRNKHFQLRNKIVKDLIARDWCPIFLNK
ncbi:MAG: hypothetical protein VXX85_03125 [Candidatus Margulisiibacteriota bacterium]|nr:hypothetical protein [Candidatus Margulisiibacteriota bacterium]